VAKQASGAGGTGSSSIEGESGGNPEPAVPGPAPGGRGWSAAEFTRKVIMLEVAAVLAVGLGRSAVDSVISLIGSLTEVHSVTKLSTQTVALNASASPRPWLDFTWQVYGIAFGLAPALLALYLLAREHVRPRQIGLDLTRPLKDLGFGALVAACIGGSGLALYLGAHAAGLAVTVVPTTLPAIWWRIPVLVGSAWENATVEEITWNGYLLRRFDQLGWGPNRSDLTSAAIRGSYHLYQGLGGFAGNLVMGLIFARLYRRWGRVTPLLIAHGLIDTTAFVGYVLLAGHVSWLPT